MKMSWIARNSSHVHSRWIIKKNASSQCAQSSEPVVPKVGGTAPLGAVRNSRGGEAEMSGWGAIGDPANNYISVVLLTLSDQMS